MSHKNQASTNKIYCEDCKAQIPKDLWSKHQFCQRHLRARAAGLFYKKRKGKALADEARKKLREDPETMLDDPRFQGNSDALGFEPTEVRKSDLVTTKSRVKGVWVLLQDVDTGATYYKNRLSGKIQRNRPIGLRDEDLEIEDIGTAGGLGKADGPKEANSEEIEEESKPGEWQNLPPTYRFGGSEVEEGEEDPTIRPFFEAQSSPSASIDESEASREEVPIGDCIEPAEIAKTAVFRAAEEAEFLSESIIEKPVFHEVAKTLPATFPKRTKKSSFQL